jgi:hypothetical protein
MDIAEIVKDSLRLWAAYELVKTLSPEDQVALYNKMFPSQQLPQTSRDIFHHIFQAGPIAIPSLTVLPAPKPSPDPEILEAGNWLKRIKHPSVVLILGKRGGGKSALGYRLLEHLRWTAKVYVIGLPKEARALLPDWIGMAASLEDVPAKSIVLVDEAYLPYHSRASMATGARTMSQLINLSRQREQTLIFVSQEARQVDRNIASSANVIIFKDLGLLQLKFDRPELNDWAIQAREKFATVKGDKRQWSFVCAPDAGFVDLVSNSLPSFWREKLSRIFAAAGEPVARAPKKMPRSQRIERARELSRQGFSQGQIAKLLGVSKPTVKNYLEDYPYKA